MNRVDQRIAEMTGRTQHVAISTSKRGKWPFVDADFYPGVWGEAAIAAGELVLEGIEATVASGRKTPFWVAMPGMHADVKPGTPIAFPSIMAGLREHVGESGCVFVTLCPRDQVDDFASRFAALADRGLINGVGFSHAERTKRVAGRRATESA